MSAHNGPLSRIFIFLLAPAEKLFECVRLEVFADIGINATVGDILDLIPSKATEPALVAQSVVGLCQRTDGGGTTRSTGSTALTNRNQRAAECINNGELLIAIPAGFTAVRCQSLVDRILKQQPKIRKLLQRTDPLAPRKSKHSKGSSGSSSGGGGVRSKASSTRSSRTTEGLTGLGLEAIEEGENESKSTMSRDDESLGASNVSDDNVTATDSKSNLNDLRKGEEEIRVAIESMREHNGSGAEEQQVGLDNEDHPAVGCIERLAREASELESSFMTMPESSISYESPGSPPRKRRMHESVPRHTRRKDENATHTSAFLSKSQQPADDNGVFSTRRDHFKGTKQRIKRAIKRKLKASTVASAAFVAFASALYHTWSPNPIGLSSYVAFIVVFSASVAILRRRKLSSSIARQRRRSRSLSTTPIRKGSIRRIQIAKATAER